MIFVTEDAQRVWLWQANPHGDPFLVCVVDRLTTKITWFQDDKGLEVPGMHWGLKLDVIISHGLASSTSTPWTQFLTKGLYDPRLFAFFIRPFL